MPARNRRNKRRSRVDHQPRPNGPAPGHTRERGFSPFPLNVVDAESKNPTNGYGIVSRNRHIRLRKYQCRMIRDSLRENTIVVLPPGAGKTVIAGEVIARIGAPALVLVPTVYLVTKHEQTLRSVTGLNVRPFSGGAVLPPVFDVLVSTPKAFEVAQSHLSKNRNLRWRNFRTVVFHEVQHVFKDHPYRKLALDMRSSAARPRVMGLTSSFAYNMHEEKVTATLKSICYDLEVHKVLTGTDDELREFDEAAWNAGEPIPEVHIKKTAATGLLPAEARKPHKMLENFFTRVLQGASSPFADRLAKCVLRMELAVSRIDATFRPPIHLDFCLKQWSVVAHRWATIPDQKQNLVDLYTQLEYWYEALRMLIVSWEEDAYASVLVLKMVKCDHPRAWRAWPVDVYEHIADFWRNEPRQFEPLEQLRAALLSKSQEIRRFRGLLFVQQRLSTHILEWFIRNDRYLSVLFTPACLYATSSPATPSLCISKIQAKQNVEGFTQGKINLLISTVVAEESMDIPTANCIIRFDTSQKSNSGNLPIGFTRNRAEDKEEEKERAETDGKEESGKVSMVCRISQEEKSGAEGERSLQLTNFPFQKSDHWVEMNDLKVRKELNYWDDIRESHRQMILELEAAKFLRCAVHRRNCEAMLYNFCNTTKINVGISTENTDKGVYLQMKYGSCLRTITVESQEADNCSAYNTAALDMVGILRQQVLTRFGLLECN